MIRYLDTRGAIDAPRTFTEAILEGIAPGGGLFVPERLPSFSVDQLELLATVPYHARAAMVYEAFGLDVEPAKTREIAARAYGPNFDHPEVAPVREVAPGRHVLELWHGPTIAFKDMALQCMPLFFCEALEQAHAKGATDLRLPDPRRDQRRHRQGGARRLRRPRPHPHRRLLSRRGRLGHPAQADGHPARATTSRVFRRARQLRRLPERGQGRVRRRQPSPPSSPRRHGLALSSANSINWGRLLPQIVYYVSAYADMVASGGVSARRAAWTCACPPATSATSSAPTTPRTWACPSAACICASNEQQRARTTSSPRGVYDISARSVRHDAVALHGHPHLVQPRAAALRPHRRPGAHRRAGWPSSRPPAVSRSTPTRTTSCRRGSRRHGWTTTPACR